MKLYECVLGNMYEDWLVMCLGFLWDWIFWLNCIFVIIYVIMIFYNFIMFIKIIKYVNKIEIRVLLIK